jgi:hypothetical protein
MNDIGMAAQRDRRDGRAIKQAENGQWIENGQWTESRSPESPAPPNEP